mmetsp:Transcript_4371/g.12550  ORF Transcript_4371/g.12550 Transcript_4371/m.12550 type:complete len:296 (+) Transcript_4371:235-1122(+)
MLCCPLRLIFLLCVPDIIQGVRKEILVGIHAHIRRNVHCFLGNFFGAQFFYAHQGPGSGERVRTPAPDRYDAVRHLQNVAVSRDLQALSLVGNNQRGLEPSQILVGPPPLGQLDAGPRQLAGIFVQLPLQPLQQGKGVRRRARKAHQRRLLLVVFLLVGNRGSQPSLGKDALDLDGVRLDDHVAHADHAVAHHADLAVFADAQNRCSVVRREIVRLARRVEGAGGHKSIRRSKRSRAGRQSGGGGSRWGSCQLGGSENASRRPSKNGNIHSVRGMVMEWSVVIAVATGGAGGMVI